jgi:putative glycosyltransferase (TIGR04372 family)
MSRLNHEPVEIKSDAAVQGSLKSGTGRFAAVPRTTMPDLTAALGRARALQQAGRLEAAVGLYRAVLAVDPDNLEPLSLAGAAALGLDRVDEAAALLEAAARRAPRVALFHFHLGLARRLQDRLDDAEAHLREAVRPQPDYFDAHVALARVTWALLEQSAKTADIAGWRRRLMRWRLTIAESIQTIEGVGDAERDPDAIKALGELCLCLSDFPRRRRCVARLRRLRERQYGDRPDYRAGRRYFELSVTNLGEYAILDMLAKQHRLGWSTDKEILVLCHADRIVNRAYLGYWQGFFPLLPHHGEPHERIVPTGYYPLDQKYVLDLPNGEAVRKERYHQVIQAEWEAQGRPPLLSVSAEHRQRGWAALADRGVPRDAWFVCLHVREGGFQYESERRKHEARNADILTYLPAIREITERGGWVVRLGHPGAKPLPALPQVIDYARSGLRADWMDVFLIGCCRFVVGTDSGPSSVPVAFGVPVVLSNVYPASARPWSRRDLYLPKLLWSEAEERYLSFRELFRPPFYDKPIGDILPGLRTRVVDNGPDELREAVAEMLDRFDGTFAYTPEDDALQARFNSLDDNDSYGFFNRVGRDFLRRYDYLLAGA